MLSPLFWLSLIAVFWGVKWIAEGVLALAAVDVRAARRQPTGEPASATVVAPHVWRDVPESLDRAA